MKLYRITFFLLLIMMTAAAQAFATTWTVTKAADTKELQLARGGSGRARRRPDKFSILFGGQHNHAQSAIQLYNHRKGYNN